MPDISQNTIARVAEYLSLAISVGAGHALLEPVTRADFVRANQLGLHLQAELPADLWHAIVKGVASGNAAGCWTAMMAVRKAFGAEGDVDPRDTVWFWPDVGKK
jgi:hypothetical protein